MEKPKIEKSYEKISPTAWGVAYQRTLSDIKYAKNIFNELDTIIQPTEPVQVEYIESVKKSKFAPQFEARFKLINRLFEENRTNQILELASGLAPRGLLLTDKYPSLRYVELDLPTMASHKRQLLGNLYAKHEAEPRGNLYIESGDALSEDSVFAAAEHFRNEPLAVINEGLLRYLNLDQKALVAQNVHALIKKFGGVWITSDITTKKVLTYEEERMAGRERVKKLSGIDVGENAFEDFAAAEKFFQNLGFSVEQHPFGEVINELVSPQKLELTRKEVEEMLKTAVVFVMRLKER